ncbi:MAG: RcnB family protein [Ramlibacter sp.]|nr:RcnB family protein [Ramlibacter sp.]
MKRRSLLPVLLAIGLTGGGVAFAQGDGDEGARRQAMEAAERAKREKAGRPAPAQVQPARPPDVRRGEQDRRGGDDARRDDRRDDRRGDPRYVQEAPRNEFRGEGRPGGRPDWNRDGRRDGYRDGYRGDGNRDGYRADRRDWSPHTRHDWRGAGPGYRFYRGDRLPYEYRHRQYVIEDWRRHNLYAPPHGYYWVQSGDDYLLVAVATGLILQILLGN